MSWWCLLAMVLLGCGGGMRVPPPPAATATPRSAWTTTTARRTPLACPASSSRAGWPSRVRALGDGRYVKLWGKRPRLADVDADGHLLKTTEIGARRTSDVRVLACGRDGQVAVAWSEYRGHFRYVLKLYARGKTVTVAHATAPYWDEGFLDAALAFAPDGSLLVTYSVYREVHAAFVSPDGKLGRPFKRTVSNEITNLAAEYGRARGIVAWTTIDSGEERNERRQIFAVSVEHNRFGHVQLVDRAKHLNIYARTDFWPRL